MTKDEIIERRKTYIPYDEAEKLQKQLMRIYKKEYKPKHNAKSYLKLILDEGVDEIKEQHPQDNNCNDTVFKCFSVVSQHVHGYTKEHCLDQIYDAVKAKRKRIKEYKLLPTLDELVHSDINIIPTEIYNYKEKGSYKDCCYGYSGDIILRMREIGIDKCIYELNKKFFDSLCKFD